ncbi:MAG: YfhO family protein [Lachnospiraceae bacterium]|nr:YfhO family protein [Lachnospiraceae bacterium]
MIRKAMLNKKNKKLNINGAAEAFLFNLAAGLVSFLWAIISQEGLFSLAGDFNSQQITFAMAANDAIKSGNWIWDWSLDLGSNFIGGQSFYLLGNPSFWVSLLFPSEYFMYVVGWLYLLKYAFAGLFGYLFIERLVRRKEFAVIASMLYAFSGFMNEALLFYHFHDVVVLFPLLLLAFDDLVKERRRGAFIFAVFINAVVNYFFFVGEVLFLLAYYVLKYLLPAFGKYIRKLPLILAEGAMGCGIGMVLLLPSFLFTIQNPRVDFDYSGSNSLVFSGERYLYILKALIFPGEMMSHQSSVIKSNFSSCCAYLPFVGMVLVIAFFILHKKHWIARMLKFSLVMALVPILNASFSLFAGLYCRWYYMPVLLMASSSAMVLDDWWKARGRSRVKAMNYVEKAVQKGALIWGTITAAFVLFLIFVKWSNSEPSKIYNEPLFAAFSLVSISGTVLLWLFICVFRKNQVFCIMAAVFMFSSATCITDIAMLKIVHNEDAMHIYDKLMTSAELTDPGPMYRFSSRDNMETLAHNYQGSANFCSTVSGSIFRFYESLGLERDVKSPEGPVGTMNLISARFDIEKEPRENEEPVEIREGTYTTYYVYENRDIPPIGFTYDQYIRASEFETVPKEKRALVMLKYLVVPDEKEAAVGRVLEHPGGNFSEKLSLNDLSAVSRSRLAECVSEAERTTDSYSALLEAEEDTYVFFSIPNDSGWSCKVNGKETDILDVNGFMAVPVEKGSSRIVFCYTVPGLFVGALITLVSLLTADLYVLYSLKKKRKYKRR